MSNRKSLLIFTAAVIGLAILFGVIYKTYGPKETVREFALEMCIASTANITEYQHSAESQGYPVGRIKALTSNGYYVMIYIPDLNVIGALEIPYSDEPKFQQVHCPAILGGDRETN